MFIVIFLILLTSAVLLEGTVTTLPLVLVCLLCFLIIKRSRIIFYSALIAGLILDLFTLQPLGSSALYFIVFLYLVILYKKKYEINSYPFVIVSAFLGSFLFLLLFGYANALISAGISSGIAVILFTVLSLL